METNNPNPTTDSTKSKINSLIKWANLNGVKFNNSQIRNSNYGLGIFYNNDENLNTNTNTNAIEKPFIEVPGRMIISVSNIIEFAQSDSVLRKILRINEVSNAKNDTKNANNNANNNANDNTNNNANNNANNKPNADNLCPVTANKTPVYEEDMTLSEREIIHRYLVYQLWLIKNKKNCLFQDWLKCLPRVIGTPISWDEGIKGSVTDSGNVQALKGTSIYIATVARRKFLRRSFDEFADSEGCQITHLRPMECNDIGNDNYNHNHTHNKETSKEDSHRDCNLSFYKPIGFKEWVLAEEWIMSRSLEIPRYPNLSLSNHYLDELAIVPIVDFANHCSDNVKPNSRYDYYCPPNAISIRDSYITLVPIEDESSTNKKNKNNKNNKNKNNNKKKYINNKKIVPNSTNKLHFGDEITISYGENKGAAELLFNYGFLDSKASYSKEITLFFPSGSLDDTLNDIAKQSSLDNESDINNNVNKDSETLKDDETNTYIDKDKEDTDSEEKSIKEENEEEEEEDYGLLRYAKNMVYGKPGTVRIFLSKDNLQEEEIETVEEIDKDEVISKDGVNYGKLYWESEFVWFYILNSEDGLEFGLVDTPLGNTEVEARLDGLPIVHSPTSDLENDEPLNSKFKNETEPDCTTKQTTDTKDKDIETGYSSYNNTEDYILFKDIKNILKGSDIFPVYELRATATLLAVVNAAIEGLSNEEEKDNEKDNEKDKEKDKEKDNGKDNKKEDHHKCKLNFPGCGLEYEIIDDHNNNTEDSDDGSDNENVNNKNGSNITHELRVSQARKLKFLELSTLKMTADRLRKKVDTLVGNKIVQDYLTNRRESEDLC